MSKQSSIGQYDTLISAVSRFPLGASLEEIVAASGLSLPKRTLQRHLALLVKEGFLLAEGETRGRRYKLPMTEPISQENSPNIGIPLSPAALSIQKLVTGPIQSRRPVGYRKEFLEKYRPNETFYLSKQQRDRLMELGKLQEKKRPAGTYDRQILSRLLIDLSWNSSRLEGNTYSLLETERLLELGESSAGKDIKEAQMILNHKAAIEFMIESAEYIKFNRFTILNLHAILSDGLLSDPRACGSLRSISVGIGASVYQPLNIPQLIEECFDQILDTAQAIDDPFEQSFFVMVHLPYLQPFVDVNKRVSRLASNFPFIRNNLCPLSFVDLPEKTYINALLGVYELTRIDLLREVFIWSYERSCLLYSATHQELGEPDPFRVQYRNEIKTLVAEVVQERMDKTRAVAIIKKKSNEIISLENQARFVELVEIELMSLHKGNIARFRLKPSEYDAWKEFWH